MNTPQTIVKQCILLLLMVSVAVAEDAVSLSFSPIEAPENLFFEKKPHIEKIVTNSDQLEITGTCVDSSTPLVIFSSNNKNYPLYPQNGVFSTQLTLENGKNQLTASLPNGYGANKNFEIIHVKPAEIEFMELKKEGSEPEAVSLLEQSALGNNHSLRIPQIVIKGKRSLPATTDLNVIDQYGNPVLVDFEDDQFFINYTLREGQNELKIDSVYEDKSFKNETITFELKDVVQLSYDEEKNPKEFIETGPIKNDIQCQSDTIFLTGEVAAITEGVITLRINDQEKVVPVKNHIFSTEATLEKDALNTIKAVAHIGDQSFFDYIKVTHVPTEATITSLSESTLSGSIFEKSTSLNTNDSGVFQTRSPAVTIAGLLKFLGEVPTTVLNQTSGKRTSITNKPGSFEVVVLLNEGENLLQIQMGNDGQKLSYDPIKINLLSPIQVEQVNELMVTDNTIEIEDHSCLLNGRVQSINRGLLTLSSGNESITAPIINGSFESAAPLQLKPGLNEVTASFKMQERSYTETITIQTPDAILEEETKEVTEVANATTNSNTPLPTGELGQVNNSEEKRTFQEGTINETPAAKPAQNQVETPQPKEEKTFTPPRPVKTNQPRAVIDPETKDTVHGSVTVRFVIGKKGRIDSDSISIVNSTNPLLEAEAIRAVSKWRFRAARLDGDPIEKATKVTLNWKE